MLFTINQNSYDKHLMSTLNESTHMLSSWIHEEYPGKTRYEFKDRFIKIVIIKTVSYEKHWLAEYFA